MISWAGRTAGTRPGRCSKQLIVEAGAVRGSGSTPPTGVGRGYDRGLTGPGPSTGSDMSAQATYALRRGSQAVLVLAVVLVAAFAVTTDPGVRSAEVFRVGVDGWLQGSAYVAIALVALVR